jgi:hypothetical protein
MRFSRLSGVDVRLLTLHERRNCPLVLADCGCGPHAACSRAAATRADNLRRQRARRISRHCDSRS